MPEARISRIKSGKRVTAARDVLYYRNNIQLVSCVRMYEEFEKRGVRTAGISIDPPEHNETMIKQHALSFPLLGDPKGDHAKRCGVCNDNQCLTLPAIVSVDRGGIARYLHAGPNFADRPGNQEVVDALDGLSEAKTGGNSAGKSVKILATPEEAADSTHGPDKPPCLRSS